MERRGGNGDGGVISGDEYSEFGSRRRSQFDLNADAADCPTPIFGKPFCRFFTMRSE